MLQKIQKLFSASTFDLAKQDIQVVQEAVVNLEKKAKYHADMAKLYLKAVEDIRKPQGVPTLTKEYMARESVPPQSTEIPATLHTVAV